MIPSMNVVRQYESIREELDQAALEVLHSGSYILGESVERFQTEFADYCGTKYAIGVGNGTDALVIALRACGVKAGDEVITTAMSFFPLLNPSLLLEQFQYLLIAHQIHI